MSVVLLLEDGITILTLGEDAVPNAGCATRPAKNADVATATNLAPTRWPDGPVADTSGGSTTDGFGALLVKWDHSSQKTYGSDVLLRIIELIDLDDTS